MITQETEQSAMGRRGKHPGKKREDPTGGFTILPGGLPNPYEKVPFNPGPGKKKEPSRPTQLPRGKPHRIEPDVNIQPVPPESPPKPPPF